MESKEKRKSSWNLKKQRKISSCKMFMRNLEKREKFQTVKLSEYKIFICLFQLLSSFIIYIESFWVIDSMFIVYCIISNNVYIYIDDELEDDYTYPDA